jgi:hypothetical protein
MNKVKPLIRIVRLGILFAILAGTFMLYRWSKSADPRFYRFVETPLGQTLAKTFGWYQSPIKQYDPAKPPDKWTDQELAIKRTLEARVSESAPTHRLHMDNGKYMEGALLDVGPDYVQFRETYGDSGSLSARVQRARIKYVEKVDSNLPPITYADVRLQLEFPSMQLYKRPPYTIVTDETYFHVERSVRVLQKLHDQFTELFGPLITKERKLENIQLAFFSNEKSFRYYQRKYAPHMEGSLGFYSPALDRFLVFNEKRSDLMKEIVEDVDAQGQAYKQQAETDQKKYRIELLKRRSQRNLQHQAEQRTFTTLRHEGAHQLFFTYGVHSSFRVENDWLIEGCAVFCEGEEIGMLHTRRVKALKRRLEKNAFMPIAELVDFRKRGGFMNFDDPEKVELAYHEAWSLVHYLMQGERRNRFFEFVRYLRDPKHLEECVEGSHFELLCRFMQTKPEQLSAAWRDYVLSL